MLSFSLSPPSLNWKSGIVLNLGFFLRQFRCQKWRSNKIKKTIMSSRSRESSSAVKCQLWPAEKCEEEEEEEWRGVCTAKSTLKWKPRFCATARLLCLCVQRQHCAWHPPLSDWDWARRGGQQLHCKHAQVYKDENSNNVQHNYAKVIYLIPNHTTDSYNLWQLTLWINASLAPACLLKKQWAAVLVKTNETSEDYIIARKKKVKKEKKCFFNHSLTQSSVLHLFFVIY